MFSDHRCEDLSPDPQQGCCLCVWIPKTHLPLSKIASWKEIPWTTRHERRYKVWLRVKRIQFQFLLFLTLKQNCVLTLFLIRHPSYWSVLTTVSFLCSNQNECASNSKEPTQYNMYTLYTNVTSSDRKHPTDSVDEISWSRFCCYCTDTLKKHENKRGVNLFTVC